MNMKRSIDLSIVRQQKKTRECRFSESLSTHFNLVQPQSNFPSIQTINFPTQQLILNKYINGRPISSQTLSIISIYREM